MVDDSSDTDIYTAAYTQLMANVQKRQNEQRATGDDDSFEHGILTDVYDTVQQLLKFGASYAHEIATTHVDKKVGLSVFMVAGRGVCRHQALLADYLLERLRREDYTSGQASIDRNGIAGVGTHA